MQAVEKLSKIVSNADAWILSSVEFQELAGELLKQGLIAHYSFNGNAQDSSGHGLHGTVYGATLTNDRFNNTNSAYQFDGIDDYIEIPHNDLLNLTDNFTISLWIKQLENNSSRGYRLVDKTTAGVNDGYNFDTYDGSTGRKLRLTGGKQNVSANTAYSLNEWHHVAVVFAKGLSTFYLDGSFDGSGQHHSDAISTNTLTLKIGAAHNSHTEFFKGAIDDVRIYNRALSEADIQELYEFPTALRQCVLVFNGQNNYISLPATNIDYSQGFSVEAWVRYNSFKYWSRIIDFGNGVGSNNIVFANPETTNQIAIDVKTSAGEKRVTSAAVLETGKWTHLAATIDQSGIAKLYKNGELIQSGQLQLPANINRTQNYIARSNWPNDGYFDGQISEVRVWNIARTQAEIQQHIHSRLTGNEASLVGYWPLNEGSGTVVADKTSHGNNGIINGATWQQQELLIKPTPVPVNLPTNSKIKLKSWKGDYLHRPDTEQGVTSWGTGVGNEWVVESIGDRKIKLKSWKGDYLHRPDTEQGVTSWGTGVGNEWVVESIGDGKIKLKSWKGDYLHRPDSQQGVTSWGVGIGNEWILEVISTENTESVLVKQGTKGGSIPAQDFEFLPKNSALKSRIKTVLMNVAWAIGSLQIEYENVGSSPAETYTTPSVGSGGGEKVKISLAPGDYITKVTGSWGRQASGYPKEEIITIQFETYKGVKSQVFGGGSGKAEVEPFVLEAPQGHEIIGFFGSHGGNQDLLIRLGIYSRAVQEVEKPVVPEPQPEPTNIAPEKPVVPEPQPEPTNIAPEKPVVPEPQPEATNIAPEKPVAPQPQPKPTNIAPEKPVAPKPKLETNDIKGETNRPQSPISQKKSKTDLIVYLFLILLVLLIAWQAFKQN